MDNSNYEEHEYINSKLPDMNSLLMQKLANKSSTNNPTPPTTPSGFEAYPAMNPMLMQQLMSNLAANGSNVPSNTQSKFDPYKTLLKKKDDEVKPIDPSTIKQWPEEDVRALQEYCEKMGIVGFSCGRMSPIAALAMLKRNIGDNYTNVPLDERLPFGYQKLGSKNSYSPSSPYSQAANKKQILHG